ncbi:MAG: CPCC family cysteine-rich protein [Polyangiaceae bacterium]
MTRSEAIARVARADLNLFPAEERARTLESMLGEAWDTDRGGRRCRRSLQEELTSGELEADPSSSRYDAAILLSIAYRYRGATNDYLIRRLGQLGLAPETIVGEPASMEACPCCGHRTLDARGQYDICVVCWWEDDGQDNQDADQTLGGPNDGINLSRARANFLIHGIYDPARDDLRALQEPPDKFAHARDFVLADGDSVVEEPAAAWRSRPISPVRPGSGSTGNRA